MSDDALFPGLPASLGSPLDQARSKLAAAEAALESAPADTSPRDRLYLAAQVASTRLTAQAEERRTLAAR